MPWCNVVGLQQDAFPWWGAHTLVAVAVESLWIFRSYVACKETDEESKVFRAACHWGCWSLTNQTHRKHKRDSPTVGRRKRLLQIKGEKPVVENMSGRGNPLKQSIAAHPTLKELTIARALSSALAVLCGMLYNLPARLRWHGHCLGERIELWCVKGV